MNKKAFTLIELLISIGVFLIIITAVYSLFTTIFKTVNQNRLQALASKVANQEMEIIRNMEYENIGTLQGNPSGNLPNTKTETVANSDFNIETYISWFDDLYDGTVEEGDTAPNDYKRVKISVCWKEIECTNPVTMISDFSSGQTEISEGKGTLKVIVASANGDPVEGAKVEFTRNGTGEYFYGYTDINGILFQYNLNPGTEIYHVVASKSGHSSDYTITPGLNITPSPDKADPSVLEDQVNPIALSIDRVSNLTIVTTDKATAEAVGNISLHLRGNKVLGTDGAGNPVYKYDQDIITPENGVLTLTGMEFDTYFTTYGPGESEYNIGGINPANGLDLDPATSGNIGIFMVPKTDFNLLTTLLDIDTKSPIYPANVNLSKEGYDETRGVTDYGQVFFESLENTAYTINITVPGYNTINELINTNGPIWKTYELEPL